MQKPVLFYCYDAYCGWCYGFSPVIRQLAEEYASRAEFEVLSGGMILDEMVQPIERMAGYILNAYPVVESTTGIKFGEDYLWHIRNPDLSDWAMDSEKPAIALSVFKEIYPNRQVEFAADLQKALHAEGRDLCDDEAYRHLLEQYSIQPELFYQRLHSDEYAERARYEFSLCKQLQVTGFPALFIQESDSRFHLLARGYTEYATLKARLDQVLTLFPSTKTNEL